MLRSGCGVWLFYWYGPDEQAPKVEQIKLIDYDFAKYGSSAERKRLLAKWDTDVKPLPR